MKHSRVQTSSRLFLVTSLGTGKCERNDECEDDQVCDNVFKVCRDKRPNGGKCGQDAGCISGHCVSGYCRECPTAGSSTGCDASFQFCQRTDGFKTHVCRRRKDNGLTCTSSNACESRYCVSGFCRECPTADSFTGCTGGKFCQRLYNGKTHVCRPQKGNGDTCTSKNACASGYCVSGFCRECPTADSSTGCSSSEFCMRLYNFQTHVCRPKQTSGKTCSSGNACNSGVCTGGFCRICTANSHCISGYKCYDNISTGFIKKCCPSSGNKKFKKCYVN